PVRHRRPPDRHAVGVTMTGAQGNRDAALGRLRRQTRQLVAELPGPLRRVRLSNGEATVEVEWPTAGTDAATVTPANANGGATHPGASGSSAPAPDGTGDGAGEQTSPPDSHDIVSPIVGTFYRAPEPGAEPFVQVGDLVEAGQVVGIVEIGRAH